MKNGEEFINGVRNQTKIKPKNSMCEFDSCFCNHCSADVPINGCSRPYKEWRLLAAIGGEIYKDQVSNEKDRGFVFRTGVGYLFPVGKDITVAPEFFVDFSEHETLFTYGLSVGYGF